MTRKGLELRIQCLGALVIPNKPKKVDKHVAIKLMKECMLKVVRYGDDEDFTMAINDFQDEIKSYGQKTK